MRQILENPLQIREQIPESLFIECVDSLGNIRLNKVRDRFGSIDRTTIMDLAAIFKKWKNADECLMLRKTDLRTGESKIIGVKASKRGNDVCSQRQNKKISFLKTISRDVEFFTQEDAEKGIAKANVLWVTLTCNSNLGSMDEAWRNLSPDSRLFLGSLEKRFGKINYFYTPEVYPNQDGSAFGYPHIHMILVFLEYKFTPFPWIVEKDGKLEFSYRIKEIQEFKEAGSWHSFVDVKAIRNANGLYSYCRKHVENTLQGDSDQAALNNAVMWFYRKKSYCMNQNFRNYWLDWITNLQVFCKKTKQIDFSGNVVPDFSWEFLGVGSMNRVGMDPGSWTAELDPGKVQDELMRKGTLFVRSNDGSNGADCVVREISQIILNHREDLINEC